MCVRSQGIDDNNGGVDGVRRAQGLSNYDRAVDGGRRIDNASEGSETTTEATGA